MEIILRLRGFLTSELFTRICAKCTCVDSESAKPQIYVFLDVAWNIIFIEKKLRKKGEWIMILFTQKMSIEGSLTKSGG